MEASKSYSTATAYRRQKQIEDCLFKNLLHTPYSSISVADICRQVGISRKAFYNYYHDKDACFAAYVDGVLHKALLETTSTVPVNGSDLDHAIALMSFWQEEKVFLDVIIRNQLTHFLFLQNMRYVLEEDRSVLDLLNTPDVKSDSDILACYTMSLITLVLQWYYRDFDTPVEEMAKKLLRILHAPLIRQTEE